MISRSQPQNETTHLINSPAYPPSAQTRAIRGQGPVSWALAKTALAPSRSWMFAGWTTTASTDPSVSTKMCRLTPLTFFPRIVPALPAGPCRLDGLAVDAAGTRLGSLPGRLAHPAAQRVVEPLPGSGSAPLMEIITDRPFRREVMRQSGPGASGAQDVEDRVEDLTKVGPSWGTHRERRREQRFEEGPSFVGEVAGIRLARLGVHSGGS